MWENGSILVSVYGIFNLLLIKIIDKEIIIFIAVKSHHIWSLPLGKKFLKNIVVDRDSNRGNRNNRA